ncbi:MAG: hypothetical protein H6688_01945 [Erysipelotrichaceae bacterium]|nr:hypothetical protein [Erysipelotrichaceae bacterium]
MNKIVQLSSNILFSVLVENAPFNMAVNHFLKEEGVSSVERSQIVKFVGCSLRHFYIFDFLVKQHLPSLDEHDRCLVFIYLSNRLFLHALSPEEATLILKSMSLKESSDKKAALTKLDEATSDVEKLIPSDVAKDSPQFLSYRFNTPLWLVKMWSKHYGEYLTYRILRANSKPASNLYLVNNTVIKREGLLNKYSDLSASAFENYVLPNEKQNLKRHSAFIKKEIIDVSPSWYSVFEKADTDPIRGIAIYSGFPNNAFLSLLNKYDNKVKFDLVIGDSQAFFASKKTIENFHLVNACYYEAVPTSVVTCISKPVHTFFVFPRSSQLALLKSTPDYFLHFTQEQLDGVIKGEEYLLHECGDLVEEGGQLIYAIPTINKKESHRLIKRFLENNPTFSLVEEQQIFPFSEYEDSLYFAILKKEVLPHD